MALTRRTALVAGLALSLPDLVVGQDKFPAKSIDVIVPWGPGGGADVLGRILARWFETDLKVAAPVMNYPGASGMIGLGKMSQAPADGYIVSILTGDSLMMAATPAAAWKMTEAIPLGVLVRQPSGIFATPQGRFKTWQDVVAAVQTNPGSVSLAITGPNTADDLTAKYLASKNVKLGGVPYVKPGERYSAVIGGHVDLLYEQAGDVRSFIEANQLKPLIFFASKRLPAPFADVPVSGELGYEILLPQVRAVLTKAGTPPERVRVLSESVERFTKSTEYRKFIDQQMALPDSFIAAQPAQAFLQGELESSRKLLAVYGEKT
jgi:tripartite-type tricarboxylate transporter receptor subunit TctC